MAMLAKNTLRSTAQRAKTADDVKSELDRRLKRRDPIIKAYWKNIRTEVFRDDFLPGDKPPLNVKRNADYAFEKHWDVDHPVYDQAKLAWLAVKFHPFWNKHRKAYEISAKNKSKTYACSGKLSRISKMGAKWESRTDSFIKFCEGRGIPKKGTDEWDDFFKEFSKTQPEQWRTQKIIAAFMRTLLDFVNRLLTGPPLTDGKSPEPTTKEKVEMVIAMLRTEGIEAIDVNSTASCLTKLIEFSSTHAPEAAHQKEEETPSNST
jgi:hypothetical protein